MTGTMSRGGRDGRPVPDPLKIIWFAMIASVVIYGVVAFAVAATVGSSAPGLPGWLFPVLAMVPAAVSVLLRSRLLRRADVSTRRAVGRVPRSAVVAPGYIAAWALDESVAVIGLVDAFLRGTPSLFPLYGAAALLLLWFHRPAD